MIEQEATGTSSKKETNILGEKNNHKYTKPLERAAWGGCGISFFDTHILAGHSTKRPDIIVSA